MRSFLPKIVHPHVYNSLLQPLELFNGVHAVFPGLGARLGRVSPSAFSYASVYTTLRYLPQTSSRMLADDRASRLSWHGARREEWLWNVDDGSTVREYAFASNGWIEGFSILICIGSLRVCRGTIEVRTGYRVWERDNEDIAAEDDEEKAIDLPDFRRLDAHYRSL